MFELLSERIGRRAEAVAAARLGVMARRAAAELPDGVSVRPGKGVVILNGPALRERLTTDAALRAWVREWAR